MRNILIELGLTENEKEIYIGMLHHPHKSAAELARILRLDKSSTYRAVESLEAQGLVFSSPKTRGTTYAANSPDSLMKLYKSKRTELGTQGNALSLLIEDLKTQASTNRNTNITVEYGIEAIRSTMNDSLNSKEKFIREMYRKHIIFDDSQHVQWVNEYAKKRVAKNIYIRNLELEIDDFLRSELKDLMTLQKKFLKEIRIRPQSLNDNNSLRIWDDHVEIISFDDNNQFIVISIVDSFVASFMKNIYDFIWEQSTIFESLD